MLSRRFTRGCVSTAPRSFAARSPSSRRSRFLENVEWSQTAGGRNREADFHGQKRSNETHASTTDPEARLYRKGPGKEAKLCFMGQALMENRNGLVVDADADEPPEQEVELDPLDQLPLRADRIERLQEHRSQELLGRDRGPTHPGVERAENSPERAARASFTTVRIVRSG